ncbi:Bcl2-associated agonist of cell death [Bagarius yarrelli]|uniref:Bcl2-associated agonist of cell death n=1 Tax=Bagarius yarrelli TaxID=175774 RepID=A0A556TZ04_BAGYA|nr:Bcl2-associated agonist of cell death [Bagarius yarrelli]
MAKICTISDDSDTSGDEEVTEPQKVSQGEEASQSDLRSSVPREEQMARFRNFSINEEDFQEATDGKSGAAVVDGDPFRPRSRSAPPVLWAAKKYGRELRKMSDEFDTLFDKGNQTMRREQPVHTEHPSGRVTLVDNMTVENCTGYAVLCEEELSEADV